MDKNSDLNIYKDLLDKSAQQISAHGGCCSTSCCNPHTSESQKVPTAPTDPEANPSEKSIRQKSADGACCPTSCCNSDPEKNPSDTVSEQKSAGECCATTGYQPQFTETQKLTDLLADSDLNEWAGKFSEQFGLELN